MRRTIWVILLVLFGVTAGVSILSASEYPSKPINLVVAYAAGGGTDVSARMFEPFMKKYLGGTIGVVNKPGGNGEVGFSAVATANPDGYTMGMLNFPVFFINMKTRKTTYSMDSFEIIGPMGGSAHTIGVAADSPIKTLDELIAAAKKDPGVMTIGSSGNFSDDYLAYLQFQKETGIELIHVAFQGAAPARTAVLGKHVNLIAFNVDEAIPFVKNNQIRLFGVMSEERDPQLPGVPTFKEQGYNIISGSTRGLAVPMGTPADVVEKLRGALKSVLEDPEYLKQVADMGQTVDYMDSEAYMQTLKREEQITETLLSEVK